MTSHEAIYIALAMGGELPARDPNEISSDAPICADCAKKLGGGSRKDICGHWIGVCAVCSEEKNCTAVRDWRWQVWPKVKNV